MSNDLSVQPKSNFYSYLAFVTARAAVLKGFFYEPFLSFFFLSGPGAGLRLYMAKQHKQMYLFFVNTAERNRLKLMWCHMCSMWTNSLQILFTVVENRKTSYFNISTFFAVKMNKEFCRFVYTWQPCIFTLFFPYLTSVYLLRFKKIVN